MSDLNFDDWVEWTFNKYSEGNQCLNRRQMKLAVISLTGKKPKLPDQKIFTFGDFRRFLGNLDFNKYIGDFSELYEKIDKEQKGYIRIQDLIQACKEFGEYVDIDVLHGAFSRVDTDNDGMISYKEFISTVQAGFSLS